MEKLNVFTYNTEEMARNNTKTGLHESPVSKHPGFLTRFALVLLFPILLTVGSCVKDPSTYPSDLLLKFSIENTSQPPHQVSIDTARIILGSLEFDGIRETGKDYYFKSHFSPPLVADLVTGTIDPPSKFNVPQGVYTRIRIVLDFFEEEESPGLYFHGSANFPGRGKIPFEITAGTDYHFEGISSDPQGSSTLSITADKTSTLEIVFKPGKWFNSVPGHFIDQAHMPYLNGVPTLVINENINKDIFDIVSFQMQQSTKAIIRR